MPNDSQKLPLTCKLSAEAHQVFREAQKEAGLPHLSDIPKRLLTLGAEVLQAGMSPIEILQRSFASLVADEILQPTVETPDTETPQNQHDAEQQPTTHEQYLNLALSKMEQMIDEFTAASKIAEQEKIHTSREEAKHFTADFFTRLGQVLEPHLKPEPQTVHSRATLDEQSEALIRAAFEQTQMQLARFTAVAFELLRHTSPHITDQQLLAWKRELGERLAEPEMAGLRTQSEESVLAYGRKNRHTKRL